MPNSSELLAHRGTPSVGGSLAFWTRGALLLLCAALSACEDEAKAPGADSGAAPPRDEAHDGQDPPDEGDDHVPDASVPAPDSGDVERDASAAAWDAGEDGEGELTECERAKRKIDTFVAAHRACSKHDDCALVSGCATNYAYSVARDFEAELTALVGDGHCVGGADGPQYEAVCRAGACERQQSALWCNAPNQCPPGTGNRLADCNQFGAVDHTNCQTKCSGLGNDAPCAEGFSCQSTATDLCFNGTGTATCPACDADPWLCRPRPACQVELSVSFSGRAVAPMAGFSVTKLELWLENRTDQKLSFSFEQPCHGPRVKGLGDFDVWGACLAAACPADPVRTELTLAPREKRLWRGTVVDLNPTTCNPNGLPAGTYLPTFELPSVQGASVCGPAASALIGSK